MHGCEMYKLLGGARSEGPGSNLLCRVLCGRYAHAPVVCVMAHA